jgi:hypothetical protein
VTQEWERNDQAGYEAAVEARTTSLVDAFPALLERAGRDIFDEFYLDDDPEVFEAAVPEAVAEIIRRLSHSARHD